VKIFKKNSGSIVLEATLILPIFLSFLLILIAFIRIAVVEMELTTAVAEVTKQVATHMYPVGIFYEDLSKTDAGEVLEDVISTLNDSNKKLMGFDEFINQYSYLLPAEINSLLDITNKFSEDISGVYDKSLSTLFQPIMDHYVDDSIIRFEHFQVTKVILPDLINGEQPYFGIEIRYDMPLNVPFFDKIITFKKLAYERVWLGDNIVSDKAINNFENDDVIDKQENEDSDDEESDDNNDVELIIDSITSPVQRGHKIRIIAEGPENRTAAIVIMYNSGFVKEIKGTFNNKGVLVSDIIIGGHSNEGVYQAIVTVDDMKDSIEFEVLSKDNMDLYLLNRKAKAGK